MFHMIHFFQERERERERKEGEREKIRKLARKGKRKMNEFKCKGEKIHEVLNSQKEERILIATKRSG